MPAVGCRKRDPTTLRKCGNCQRKGGRCWGGNGARSCPWPHGGSNTRRRAPAPKRKHARPGRLHVVLGAWHVSSFSARSSSHPASSRRRDSGPASRPGQRRPRRRRGRMPSEDATRTQGRKTQKTERKTPRKGGPGRPKWTTSGRGSRMATGGPHYERRRSKRGGGRAASTARALPLAGRLRGLRRNSATQRAPPTPTAAHRSSGDRHRVYRHQWPVRPHWRGPATRMGVRGTITRSVSGMPAGTATADGDRGPFARHRFSSARRQGKRFWRAGGQHTCSRYTTLRHTGERPTSKRAGRTNCRPTVQNGKGGLATYPGAVQACLWPDAMVWAAQRLSNAKLSPLGAKILARHPPKAALGMLAGRSVTAVYLHQSARTAGAAHIGLLNRDRIQGKADRRTIRAVLGQDGKWVFPKTTCVEKRRQATSEGGGDDAAADTHSDNEWFDGNAERNIQGACQELSSSFLDLQDDAMRDYLNTNRKLSAEPERGRQDKRARPTGGHATSQGDDADEGAERQKDQSRRTNAQVRTVRRTSRWKSKGRQA